MIGPVTGEPLPDVERAKLDALLARIDSELSPQRSDLVVGAEVTMRVGSLRYWGAAIQLSFADKPTVSFWDRPFFAKVSESSVTIAADIVHEATRALREREDRMRRIDCFRVDCISGAEGEHRSLLARFTSFAEAEKITDSKIAGGYGGEVVPETIVIYDSAIEWRPTLDQDAAASGLAKLTEQEKRALGLVK